MFLYDSLPECQCDWNFSTTYQFQNSRPSENTELENDNVEEQPVTETSEAVNIEETSEEPEPETEVPEEPIIPVKPEMVSIATDTTDLETNTEDYSTSINTESSQNETTSTSCDIDTEVKIMKEESTQTEGKIRVSTILKK